MILFAALYAARALGRDPDPELTYGFGAAAVMATAIVVASPRLLARRVPTKSTTRRGRLARATHFLRDSLGDGIHDALVHVGTDR